MGWFHDLFGADEGEYETTQQLFGEENDELIAPNGRRFRPGRFETPSLAELRTRVAELDAAPAPLEVEHAFADVREEHQRPEAAGATFQVASQLLPVRNPSLVEAPHHRRAPRDRCCRRPSAGRARKRRANTAARAGSTASR